MATNEVPLTLPPGSYAPPGLPPGDPQPTDRLIGCINPRALTEALLGRTVDWSDSESTALMCDVLQTPYNELFDMKYNSPLYAGLKIQDGKVVRMSRDEITILEQHQRAKPDPNNVKKLEDLKDLGISDIGSIKVESAATDKGKLLLTLNVPELNTTITNSSMPQQMFDLCLGRGPGSTSKATKGVAVNAGAGPWVPAGGFWRDTGGSYFRDAAEFNDPVQGGMGDCWLIAALSAVAWSMPTWFVQRTRPIGTHEMESVLSDIGTNVIPFWSKATGRNAPTANVEVTNKLCVSSPTRFMYATSSDSGEIWPAVYEKAFAKWSTQDGTDFPDIGSLWGGDALFATAQLTNRTPTGYDTGSRSADDIYNIVNLNCSAQKTFNPMTAWTYYSDDKILPKYYDGSSIAANHAYTILGCTTQGGKKYIILRNPWGFFEPPSPPTVPPTEPKVHAYEGVVMFYDTSFWRPISMLNPDGVFAMLADDFKHYYAGFGVAV